MTDRFTQVADHVRAMIAQASGSAAFRDLLTRLMARPDFLAPQRPMNWPSFVLDPCEALGGDPEAAIGAAAAVEFAISSTDIADDIADDEWDSRIGQWTRALNASMALSWLGQYCACQLAGRLGAERARLIGLLLAEGMVTSCTGQDLDLMFETRSEVSEEMAHEMTRWKSGSLVAMACKVGAAVATDNPAVLEVVGQFGTHVGVVGQLLNDLAGVAPDDPARGSDLRRRKKTLPVAYALRCAREEGLSSVLTWYEGTAPHTDEKEEQLATTIRDLGALHYAWVVADSHRREAFDGLAALARLTGREEVLRLRRLVPTTGAQRTQGEAH
ncbi:MAG: polyprenyl synthetase family protein [Chloroflexi bacterium]|nr:polyprenyl synthetase family protein [Chloroflexota bacterium]